MKCTTAHHHGVAAVFWICFAVLLKEIPKSRSQQTNDRKTVEGRVRGRDSKEAEEGEEEREGGGEEEADRGRSV